MESPQEEVQDAPLSDLGEIEEGEQQLSDSDQDAPVSTCPLCAIDEVVPETAVTVASDNAYIRRIMAQVHGRGGEAPLPVLDLRILFSFACAGTGALRHRP